MKAHPSKMTGRIQIHLSDEFKFNKFQKLLSKFGTQQMKNVQIVAPELFVNNQQVQEMSVLMHKILSSFSNIQQLQINDDRFRRYFQPPPNKIESVVRLDYHCECLVFQPNSSEMFVNFANLKHLNLSLKSFYWINLMNIKSQLPHLQSLSIHIPQSVSPNKPQQLDKL